MSEVLRKWIGKSVVLTLRATMPARIEGILVEADECFFVLEQDDKRQLLIPATAVLHVAKRGNDM